MQILEKKMLMGMLLFITFLITICTGALKFFGVRTLLGLTVINLHVIGAIAFSILIFIHLMGHKTWMKQVKTNKSLNKKLLVFIAIIYAVLIIASGYFIPLVKSKVVPVPEIIQPTK